MVELNRCMRIWDQRGRPPDDDRKWIGVGANSDSRLAFSPERWEVPLRQEYNRAAFSLPTSSPVPRSFPLRPFRQSCRVSLTLWSKSGLTCECRDSCVRGDPCHQGFPSLPNVLSLVASERRYEHSTGPLPSQSHRGSPLSIMQLVLKHYASTTTS